MTRPGTERLITILDEPRRLSRCKYCKAPIEWATKAATHRRPAKRVPIEPNPFVLRYERNPETHVRFQVIAANNQHFMRCPKQPLRERRGSARL